MPAAVRVLFHSQTFKEPESAGIYLGFVAGAIGSNPAKAEQLVDSFFPVPEEDEWVIVRAIAYSGLPDWRNLLRKVAPKMPARKVMIDAYLDVRRDQEQETISQDNVNVLARQLEETDARFDAGQLTRTDTAQSEARLALARSQLAFDAGTTGPERIAACKALLRDAMADLRARHDQVASGLEIENGRAAVIDVLISKLFDHAISLYATRKGPTPAAVSLIGGPSDQAGLLDRA